MNSTNVYTERPVVYREQAHRKSSDDTIVVCIACAGLASVNLEEMRHETFRCSRCELEQPVLRPADDVTIPSSTSSKLEVLQVHPGHYDELTPFLEDLESARRVPLIKNALAVDLRCDGITCHLGLSINSGNVTGVDMSAYTPGLSCMRLIRESFVHVDKKSRGIVREVQTGDEQFDDSVYIETDVSDAEVRKFLASPAIRAATVTLLGAHTESIKIDEDGVSIFMPNSASDAFTPSVMRDRLMLLRALAGGPRPFVSKIVDAPAAAFTTKAMTFGFPPMAMLMLVTGLMRYPTITATPFLIGIIAGVVLALALGPLFTKLLKGRSTSHRDIRRVRIGSLVSLPLFSIGALLAYNGALDRSPEQSVEMVVRAVSVDSDDNAVFHVTTRDADRDEHSYSFHGTPNLVVGTSKVRAHWRSGALGWRRETRDAEAIP